MLTRPARLRWASNCVRRWFTEEGMRDRFRLVRLPIEHLAVLLLLYRASYEDPVAWFLSCASA